MTNRERVEGYRLSEQQEEVWGKQGEEVWETRCRAVVGGEVEEGRLRRAVERVVERQG